MMFLRCGILWHLLGNVIVIVFREQKKVWPRYIEFSTVLWHRFIEKYGTHIIVGLKMGGKDVISIRQLQKSLLQPAEVQSLLKEWADEKFTNLNGSASVDAESSRNQRVKFQKSLTFCFSHESHSFVV